MPLGLDAYGGTSLHEVSHGESFLAIVLNRFGPDGFYVLDEPEAALSPQNVLTLVRRIHQLVEDGSQFVIATHSPLLLALPGAQIVLCDTRRTHRDRLRRRATGRADPAGPRRPRVDHHGPSCSRLIASSTTTRSLSR